MRTMRCADSGLLVELDGLREVQALYGALTRAAPEGVLDVVPAARTLLLHLEAGADIAEVERAVRETRPADSQPDDGGLLRVPVVYDGEDLA
ncbi:MAG: carboxyltransferase domain-containing protein, partial [Saccharopolyspora sp.]